MLFLLGLFVVVEVLHVDGLIFDVLQLAEPPLACQPLWCLCGSLSKFAHRERETDDLYFSLCFHMNFNFYWPDSNIDDLYIVKRMVF